MVCHFHVAPFNAFGLFKLADSNCRWLSGKMMTRYKTVCVQRNEGADASISDFANNWS